ncbi:MAG: hypothetical protein QHH13_03230 [Melioribacter sp.]|uniref:hypothetical protein n=1 Tax=Rosettibacter primus TaxID=3111523 RepID=UPI00247EB5AD|nr:hypothetical protein [Melioribacter sp.]
MKNSSENIEKSFLKKYLPILPIIILTILLMIFFHHNKDNVGDLIEKGKKDLISFYMENLRPIFSSSQITNEDVFNFALYRTIPVDKKNDKVLIVSDKGNNQQVFEIKKIPYNKNTENYKKFVEYMELNENEKEKVDSILNSYKKEISLSILMNDNKTIAINPKLAELQKIITADLINYLVKINRNLADKRLNIPKNINFKEIISLSKMQPDNKYIFITPDTIFKKSFNFDTNKIKLDLDGNIESHVIDKKLKEINIELSLNKRNKKVPKYFSSVDSNNIKITIPIELNDIMPVIKESINVKVVNKFLEDINKKERLLKKQKHELKDEIQLNFENPIEFVNKALEMAAKQKDWEEFGKKMDSLGKQLEKKYSDSVYKSTRKYKKPIRD